MKKTILLLGFSILIGVGCSNESGQQNDQTSPVMGMSMAVAVPAASCVAGIEFAVTPCAGGDTVTAKKVLESMTLPDGIPAFENNPFDAASSHLFADNYFVLLAGCYDVVAYPLDVNNARTDCCSMAAKNDVVIVDGETTEILLVLQCKGVDVAGLDVVGALNHPPTIKDLTFHPSKFIQRCESTSVCVTAVDPDNDPLQFSWSIPVTDCSTQSAPGTATQCCTITLDGPETYQVLVTVKDLVVNPLPGDEYITWEKWFADYQSQTLQSRDWLTFPIHVGNNPDITGPCDQACDCGSECCSDGPPPCTLEPACLS